MEAIWDSANFAAVRQMMDHSVRAQEVYAANLAHVNTAGYQRREVDGSFLAALRAQLAEGQVERSDLPALRTVVDERSPANSPSGNNVALAKELQAMQSNALTYNFLTRYARGRLEGLSYAIRGR